MIKEDKVLVKINIRNKKHYLNLGYLIQDEIYVKVYDLPNGTKNKVTAICEICGSESYISYSKYLVNKNRGNKGYYSCFGCKNHVKEKTCMEKWGVKSYSMTDEFKSTESDKWKGIQKGSEKGKKTMLKKYGVDSYFKTDESREFNSKWMSSEEFKSKSKKTMLEKYGVDSYSKTDEFKFLINSKMSQTIEKIKTTFLEKYGNEYLSKTEYWKYIFKSKLEETIQKCKKTCLEKYGVDNVSKVSEIKDRIRLTKELNGDIIPEDKSDDWYKYKKIVRCITKSNKNTLYENWDGYDYYDSELIKGYLSHTHTHRFYPTIDHKISVYYGFKNSIDPNIIGSIDNLCITKRFINSTKSSMIEEEFTNYQKPE
jgi:hypothetical protein